MSDPSTQPIPNILIMAGQRLGKVDPLSARHGLEHKCLVPMLGRPLISWVLDAVDKAFPGCRIVISINDPAALAEHEVTRRFADEGRLTLVPSSTNLLESMLAAAGELQFPVLMTTGDNVLVTAEAYRAFYASAMEQRADVAALLAHKADVMADHPQGQSRFWKFRDGEYSNCNTFFALDEDALQVGEIFRGGGQFLKFPKRFVKAFGLVNLIGYRLGLFSMQNMLDRVSRRFGKRIRAHISDRGRFAIDVDDQATYDATERLLREDGLKGPGE